MKKGLVILLFIILLSTAFFSVNVLAVAENTCGIVARSQCDNSPTNGYIVMGLSGMTNAHGEIASAGNYNTVLCCNIGSGDTTCNQGGNILKLSSSTNAHAELTTGTQYATNICYEDFQIAVVSKGSNCPTDYFPLLSLSSDTNAHISGPDDYSKKICFTSSVAGLVSQGYWANYSNINKGITLLNNGIKVRMVLKGLDLTPGTIAKFNIYENDDGPVDFFDDKIRTGPDAISAIVDLNGNANATWEVTNNDLAKTDDYKQFYFNVIDSNENMVFNGESEGEFLEIDPTIISDLIDKCAQVFFCNDYAVESDCSAIPDPCGVAQISVPSNVDCSNSETNCYCSWNSNQCNAGFNLAEILTGKVLCNLGTDNGGGSCTGTGTCKLSGDGNSVLNMQNQIICSIANGECSVNSCNILSVGETKIGSCRIHDEQTSNSCSTDGIISYSWKATWIWDISNSYNSKEDCEENGNRAGECVEDPAQSGTWRYDPLNKKSLCADGQKTIICPAQIELSFFGLWNFIVALLLIAMIYVILSIQIQGKRRQKRL